MEQDAVRPGRNSPETAGWWEGRGTQSGQRLCRRLTARREPRCEVKRTVCHCRPERIKSTAHRPFQAATTQPWVNSRGVGHAPATDWRLRSGSTALPLLTGWVRESGMDTALFRCATSLSMVILRGVGIPPGLGSGQCEASRTRKRLSLFGDEAPLNAPSPPSGEGGISSHHWTGAQRPE